MCLVLRARVTASTACKRARLPNFEATNQLLSQVSLTSGSHCVMVVHSIWHHSITRTVRTAPHDSNRTRLPRSASASARSSTASLTAAGPPPFLKISIIISSAPHTRATCPPPPHAVGLLLTVLVTEVCSSPRSGRPKKRCHEGWSTGPLQGRPPPIADLTRAMCVSGDSVHFRSGPPPAAEVVQWTRHLVQGGPLPAERPTGSQPTTSSARTLIGAGSSPYVSSTTR